VCYLARTQSMLGMKTHGNNIGSRKVEPLNMGTPLWRKYVNYGLRELARAWYGVGNYPETFSEALFLEHFREAMRQYALEKGVEWDSVKHRIYSSYYLGDYKNGLFEPLVVFDSPMDEAVWQIFKGFYGDARIDFLSDKVVREYLVMAHRYFGKLRNGKRPPFSREDGIAALEYYEALEIPSAISLEMPKHSS